MTELAKYKLPDGTYREYSEKKTADRINMARALVALQRSVAPMRVMSEIIMDAGHDQDRVEVRISGSRGLAVTVSFRGKSPQERQNTFVLSWHFSGSRESEGAVIGRNFAADVNTVHFRKATDVVYSFDQLMTTMEARFAAMESGAAVEDAPTDPPPRVGYRPLRKLPESG